MPVARPCRFPLAGLTAVLVLTTVLVLDPGAPAVAGGAADLAVDASVHPDTARVGKKLTYTIAVTNAGPDAATGVTLTDQFQVNSGVAPGDPRNYRFHRATASTGTCDHADAEGTITCRLGTVPAGGSVEVHVTLSPLEEGSISNTAYAYSEAFSDDPDLSNNEARTTTAIVH